jgi:probable HAF family extracellular repeat protein
MNATGEVTGAIDPNYPDEFTVEPDLFIFSNGTTTDLGDDNPDSTCGGVSGVVGYGIGDNGDVVGAICATTEFASPFVYANGSLTVVTLPPASISGVAVGVNSHALVTGTLESATVITGCPANYYHTFLYNLATAVFQDLGGVIGPCGSHGQAINDAGQVVGYFNDPSEQLHAYLYSSKTKKGIDLGYLLFNSPPPYCGYSAQANAISSNGLVTGYSQGDCQGPEAFIYSNGTMHDAGNLVGPGGSIGNGINASGQVTGQAYTANNAAQHAFLYSNGSTQDLNSLISSADSATYTLLNGLAIDDSGEILATGYANANPTQVVSLVLTPTSPASLAATLGSTSVDGSGNYIVTLNLSNSGGAPANSTGLKAAKLTVRQRRTVVTIPASSIPTAHSDLAPGATATFTLSFPPLAGSAGTTAELHWTAADSNGRTMGELSFPLP